MSLRAWPLAAVVLLALAQVARQLGGDRVARGDVELDPELVASLLELLDVGLRLRVGGDGLAHLLAVRLRRLLQLGRVDRRPEQLAQPPAERERRTRAGGERDVVRDGG